jgi:superfamily II DNA or RNA helicase
MQFRGYQEAYAQAALAEIARLQRVLLVAPTGAGKSVIILRIIQLALAAGLGPVLVTVHKTDLVDQLTATLRRWLVDARGEPVPVAVEQGRHTDLSDGVRTPVAVASIQTLQTRPDVATAQRWGLVVTDECHRAIADGYQAFYESVGCYADGGAKLVGFTATDYRGDDQPLSTIFQSVPMKRDLKWGIREGWLVPVKAQRVLVELSDGTDRQLAKDERQRKFLEVFLAKPAAADGKTPDGRARYRAKHPTLVMAPSVDEGRELEDALRALGVDARMVDSRMDDPSKRHEYTEAFRTGALDVLIGYNLFIEGFDAPRAAVLCMLRDTESPVTYVQALGRVLRPDLDPTAFQTFNALSDDEAGLRRDLIAASAKPYAYVYDFTSTTANKNLWTIGRVFNLSNLFDFEGADVLETADEVEAFAADLPIVDPTDFKSAREMGMLLEDVDLWREAVTPNVGVPSNATLTYAKQGDVWTLFFTERKYFQETGEKERVTWSVQISRDALGQWQAFVDQPEQWKTWYWNGHGYKTRACRLTEKMDPTETIQIRSKKVPKFVKIGGMAPRFLINADSQADIFYLVENWVFTHFPEPYRFARYDAPWRWEHPSPGQWKQLRRLFKKGVALPDQILRGTVSLMLDLHYAGRLNVPNPKRRVGARKRRAKAPATTP